MNMRTLHLVVIGALTFSGCATGVDSSDVKQFVDRRDMCDHMRGEFPDPPDPERVAEVEAGIDADCTGTDSQLAALKVKYASDAAIMKILDAYEPQIERKTAR